MGTPTSGGQRVKSECLGPVTVITSCVEPEVVAVKAEADYTNVVNIFHFTDSVFITSDTVYNILMALHLSYGAVFDGKLEACVNPVQSKHEQLLQQSEQ